MVNLLSVRRLMHPATVVVPREDGVVKQETTATVQNVSTTRRQMSVTRVYVVMECALIRHLDTPVIVLEQGRQGRTAIQPSSAMICVVVQTS